MLAPPGFSMFTSVGSCGVEVSEGCGHGWKSSSRFGGAGPGTSRGIGLSSRHQNGHQGQRYPHASGDRSAPPERRERIKQQRCNCDQQQEQSKHLHSRGRPAPRTTGCWPTRLVTSHGHETTDLSAAARTRYQSEPRLGPTSAPTTGPDPLTKRRPGPLEAVAGGRWHVRALECWRRPRRPIWSRRRSKRG